MSYFVFLVTKMVHNFYTETHTLKFLPEEFLDLCTYFLNQILSFVHQFFSKKKKDQANNDRQCCPEIILKLKKYNTMTEF